MIGIIYSENTFEFNSRFFVFHLNFQCLMLSCNFIIMHGVNKYISSSSDLMRDIKVKQWIQFRETQACWMLGYNLNKLHSYKNSYQLQLKKRQFTFLTSKNRIQVNLSNQHHQGKRQNTRKHSKNPRMKYQVLIYTCHARAMPRACGMFVRCRGLVKKKLYEEKLLQFTMFSRKKLQN